jgi:UDP-N-acetyl-alpha-D-muramoyl-L-alanyl-L-glutamate epimerase
MTHREFVFDSYRYDAGAAMLALRYRFVEGPRFEETLNFDIPPRALSSAEAEVLDRIFRLIFLMSGVSYYKAFVPPVLRCEPFTLDHDTAHFLERFYENGLAEFAWKNRISLHGHCRFVAESVTPAAPIALALARRSCVPVGGGKDSLVTVECLKAAGEEPVLFALGDAAPIADCIAMAGLPSIRVRRRLDPALLQLNDSGALNGHVPITGILSAIALASAVLAGCDTVVMSNEHSANAPNLVADGVAVNHQFSKSVEFECDLAAYMHDHISRGIAYFSLLRPLSEIEIARRFARYPQYFGVFRSCNTAFRQSPAARGRNWCGNCPKCRFVFLALAPFVDKRRLLDIFGRDLLDDKTQFAGFAALCGLSEHKPFECVGETEESAAVVAHLAGEPDWQGDAVVRQLTAEFPALRQIDLAAYRALLEMRHPHCVPPAFLAMLDACG